MMRHRSLNIGLWAMLLSLWLLGCQNTNEQNTGVEPRKASSTPTKVADPAQWAQQAQNGNATPNAPQILRGKVLETMDAGGYTYVKIAMEGKELWAAGPMTKVSVGDEVQMPVSLLMKSFESKTLGRKFDQIFFVQSISGPQGTTSTPSPSKTSVPNPAPSQGQASSMGMHDGSSATKVSKQDVGTIPKLEQGLTIEEIYAQHKALQGKEVQLRGRVVKFNANIMGKNWIHIQDGTGGENNHDLTLTTSTEVKVGDIVVVKGLLTLNRDFGMGYFYPLIVEDAKVEVEKTQ